MGVYGGADARRAGIGSGRLVRMGKLKRVNIKAILKDPKQREELLKRMGEFLIAIGRTT